MKESCVLIKCDGDPSIPFNGFTAKNLSSGPLVWSPDNVELYSSDIQKNGGCILCRSLLDEMGGRTGLNACALDNLRPDTPHIPDDWRDKNVIFPDTAYSDPWGEYRRFLFYHNGWGSYRISVGSDLGRKWRVALLKMRSSS